jgi:hypothetical protein
MDATTDDLSKTLPMPTSPLGQEIRDAVLILAALGANQVEQRRAVFVRLGAQLTLIGDSGL